MPGVEYKLEPVPGVERRRAAVGARTERHDGLSQDREAWRACSRRRTGGTTRATSSRSTREGYVTIKGRAKRFAKIGGEMVSLAAIELLAAELWPNALSAAATEIDPRKGERIVLVTQQKDATRADFQGYAKSKGASDLMIPAEIMIVGACAAAGLRQARFRGRDENGARARALCSVQSAAAQRSARAHRRQRHDFGVNRGCATTGPDQGRMLFGVAGLGFDAKPQRHG